MITIVEGSSDTQSNLQLANATDGLILLVVRYGDGLSAVAKEYGSRLAGVIINGLPKYRAEDAGGTLAADLESSGTKLLGSIPDDRRMLAPRIGQVAEFLGGQFLNGEDQSDRLLDNFLIGGLVLDWGPFYFSSRKNTGVIVRGDRPDVQIAAIQTDTTRALVLTKGVRPVEYVVYEAEQRGIPLVVVPGNTHDVAEQLEGLQPQVEFDHADKLARMVDMVSEHIDIEALADQLAQPATR
jgi:BioD-like phosphotransacetylase family protein